jgi:hypothetical protein
MSQECGFPISYPKPTTLNQCCDNVTLLLEHLKALLDVIWLTDQGETSPSLVASLGGNLCEELERRIKVFYEMAREQEQRLAQLSAIRPAVSREE